MKINSYDLEECKLLIKEGSHSFYAASKLLPKYVRDPAIVLYAFCRIADDVVDKETKIKKNNDSKFSFLIFPIII